MNRFASIHDLSLNVKRIDLDKATSRALKARSEDISNLNREQLQEGKRADDTFLPPYSQNSIQKFGKPAGRIKLFDTGAFYDGIRPEFGTTGFDLKDTDSKTDMLQETYGNTIIGLSDERIGELAQDSLGSIQYEIRQQL